MPVLRHQIITPRIFRERLTLLLRATGQKRTVVRTCHTLDGADEPQSWDPLEQRDANRLEHSVTQMGSLWKADGITQEKHMGSLRKSTWDHSGKADGITQDQIATKMRPYYHQKWSGGDPNDPICFS